MFEEEVQNRFDVNFHFVPDTVFFPENLCTDRNLLLNFKLQTWTECRVRASTSDHVLVSYFRAADLLLRLLADRSRHGRRPQGRREGRQSPGHQGVRGRVHLLQGPGGHDHSRSNWGEVSTCVNQSVSRRTTLTRVNFSSGSKKQLLSLRKNSVSGKFVFFFYSRVHLLELSAFSHCSVA